MILTNKCVELLYYYIILINDKINCFTCCGNQNSEVIDRNDSELCSQTNFIIQGQGFVCKLGMIKSG